MIEAKGLTKHYGDFIAIEDVTFKAEKGEILGLLGPNGAGKTTTMRILTGYIPATSGDAKVAGYDILTESLEARRHLGYLPETVPLYTDMTVREYLGFAGKLHGLSNAKVAKRSGQVIDTCRLGEYRDTLIGKLSKGFRQRVGIAQAIIHEPDVLILDEPTIGIDPRQVVETRNLIKELGGEHTVILSTHILPEVSMVCGRVIIINEGRVVAMDKPQNLSDRLGGASRIVMDVRGPDREIVQTLSKVEGVKTVTSEDLGGRQRYTVDFRPNKDLREDLARLVVNRGWGLLALQPQGLSLEEIFLKLTTREDI